MAYGRYVKHEVEVAAWGPYQACNINPDRPNDPFTCEGARTQVSVPAHDLEMYVGECADI